MALMNILAMSSAFPPMTISIEDCTKHMAEGGKKDASYIADLFDKKVMEYDPLKTCTDVFYFDGGSNVQKAGEVLMARFPCSFCFHGGNMLFLSSSPLLQRSSQLRYDVCLRFRATYNQLTYHSFLFTGFDSQNMQAV
jgi:hypothetical protein